MIYSVVSFVYCLVAVIFQAWIFLSELCTYAYNIALSQYDVVSPEYDYIIVGAGTAGSIVASRLAQDLNASVLLIEAGGREILPWASDIPIASPLLQLTSQDWKYKTTPQEHACFGLVGNASRWPRGKVVGGTSRLNYMVYLRGHWRDYNLWTEERDENWNGKKDILQYFKKSENQKGQYKYNLYHSTVGDMVVSDAQHTTPLADAFLRAGEELGYDVRDLNGEIQTGFMQTQVHVNMGKRWSADSGFLQKNKVKNLKILSNAEVTKVLFRDNYEAQGVEGVQFKRSFKIRARRAVVLSSGVIGTPKILLHSGIGPKEHLESLEIPVIRDLPVGKNLQDHITTGLDLVLLNKSLSLNLEDIASLSSAWQYVGHGKGPWTSTGCEATGVVHTRFANPTKDPPDLQIMALPMGLSSDYGSHMRAAMGLRNEVWTQYFSPLRGKSVASIMPVLLHPKSRGEVKLKSSRVEDAPIINPNYLSEENDVEVLYEGLQLVKKLIHTDAFLKLGARLYSKSFPGCEDTEFDSAAYWKCYIRHFTLTAYHPVGTCKMGAAKDASSVVDSQLRVHGTNKLFVIDASVLPSLPSGNINAAVMMVAEKGADGVKLFWHQTMAQTKKEDIWSYRTCRVI